MIFAAASFTAIFFIDKNHVHFLDRGLSIFIQEYFLQSLVLYKSSLRNFHLMPMTSLGTNVHGFFRKIELIRFQYFSTREGA